MQNLTTNPDCLFCKIINKTIASYIIYEDQKTLAFLDIMPVSKGHLLIVPKTHYANFLEANETDIFAVMQTAKTITQQLKEQVASTDFNIIINNGAKAGQTIHHLHCHIIPRYSNEANPFTTWKTLSLTKESFEELQAKLQITK